MTDLPAYNEAETNCMAIEALTKEIFVSFVKLGVLLMQNQDKAFYSAAGFSGFKEYTEAVGLTDWTMVTRLVNIGRVVTSQQISFGDASEIGYSKMCLLLPKFRKGEVSQDLIQLAKVAPNRDLRLELGHKISEETFEEYVTCTRCGYDVILNRGMIKRR